jgi:hypothetical protein
MWKWAKDLCASGDQRAASSGQWLATATSNFSGLHFPGTWYDIKWHQQQAGILKSAQIADPLRCGHR